MFLFKLSLLDLSPLSSETGDKRVDGEEVSETL